MWQRLVSKPVPQTPCCTHLTFAAHPIPQSLLLEMAADRRAAQERLSDLQQRMVALAGPAVAAAEALGLERLGVTLEEAAAATAEVTAAATAAHAAVAAPPKAPPAPPAAPVAPKPGELRKLAEAARAVGEAVFTWPQIDTVKVGSSLRLFYDRCSGPLPRDGRLRLKAGLNKWEEILQVDMKRSEELAGIDRQEWWEVEVQLPEELFK